MCYLLKGGWARERWTDPLFTCTFPTWARTGRLGKGCKIWLPNLQCINDLISDHFKELTPYFIISTVEDPLLNPLYRATENCEDKLLLCPDKFLPPLIAISTQPFFVLELRDVFILS